MRYAFWLSPPPGVGALGFLLGLLLLPIGVATAGVAWDADLEAGAAFPGYNDIRIPGDGGTDLSLTEELSGNPASVVRLRAGVSFNDAHVVSLLVAPFELVTSGSVDRAVDFEDQTFPAGTFLRAFYQFNSYRLTYRYEGFDLHPRLQLGVGFTAKIRDAAIKLEDGTRSAVSSNVGFVPLLNFKLRWEFLDGMGMLLQGDALAAPQGRAEDVLLALWTRPFPDTPVTFRVGYRLLEGGADNDEVYTFTLVHFLTLGVSVRFE